MDSLQNWRQFGRTVLVEALRINGRLDSLAEFDILISWGMSLVMIGWLSSSSRLKNFSSVRIPWTIT